MSAADRVNHEKKSQELRDNLIRSVFREPMLLYEMRKCPYINSLDHIVSPAQRGMFYAELQYMNQDLEKVVEEENEGILLCETWGTNGVRSLLYQIISAVDFIHSAGVAHRNLYPAAILLNGKSAQVGSFSQAISTNTLVNLPKYIPGDKRFAAPELWVQRYDSIPANLWKCIDMWAIGCLMAYVLRGAPLFELIPGNEGNEWLAQ
eukprot:CAMPEP_0206197762 /NCGR_PEP_ID=MMETSP0166-20121206/9241_1 /ASSEMBLY_ACC=CAM_ASM_000260 /TAXON_ID=95228 /ORGANISM="Vannella robusta, Strain DIVA3 518/3/11/1/6" /LENGTH=205 /DNA_ID=CAMNT_0053615499 /DNA_START=82 /DNA_END=696 /DNA_ORIENTATION=-